MENKKAVGTEWFVVHRQYYDTFTPAYGYGEFPGSIWILAGCVEAETKLEAKNKYTKLDSNAQFGGQFEYMIYREEELPEYIKSAADNRLTSEQIEVHNSILKKLSIR